MKAATASAKAAADAATAANSARDTATKSSTEAAQLAAATSQDHDKTSQTVTETQALLDSARTSEANLQKVFEHLAQSDETATGHEKRVKDLADEVEALKNRVEGLLPGATSAGLASSFNKQRSRFMRPQKEWLWTFVTCISLLFLLALPSFLAAIGWIHQTDQSWNATWRSLTLRLPIALPIIWLAIYAGRNYMLAAHGGGLRVQRSHFDFVRGIQTRNGENRRWQQRKSYPYYNAVHQHPESNCRAARKNL
jgi:hypothetical protein